MIQGDKPGLVGRGQFENRQVFKLPLTLMELQGFFRAMCQEARMYRVWPVSPQPPFRCQVCDSRSHNRRIAIFSARLSKSTSVRRVKGYLCKESSVIQILAATVVGLSERNCDCFVIYLNRCRSALSHIRALTSALIQNIYHSYRHF